MRSPLLFFLFLLILSIGLVTACAPREQKSDVGAGGVRWQLPENYLQSICGRLVDYFGEESSDNPLSERIRDTLPEHIARIKRVTIPYTHYDKMRLAFGIQSRELNRSVALPNGTILFSPLVLSELGDEEVAYLLGYLAYQVKTSFSRKRVEQAYAELERVVDEPPVLSDEESALVADAFLEIEMSANEKKEAHNYSMRLLELHNIDERAAVSALQRLTALGYRYE